MDKPILINYNYDPQCRILGDTECPSCSAALDQYNADLAQYEESLQPAPEAYFDADKFWMVVGNLNSPQVRHTSYFSAQEEAERLSLNHIGDRFYVVESISVNYADRPDINIRYI